MTTIYDYKMADYKGNEVDFEIYRGKVLLIVNTATKCRFSPQYNGLERLYDTYKERGFVILDFPCSQFGDQLDGTSEEIAMDCQAKYGVKFPIFHKVDVNGANEAPLFTFLKAAKSKSEGGTLLLSFVAKLVAIGQDREECDIKWNFTKFLIDRKGDVVHRYAPNVPPEKIRPIIEELL